MHGQHRAAACPARLERGLLEWFTGHAESMCLTACTCTSLPVKWGDHSTHRLALTLNTQGHKDCRFLMVLKYLYAPNKTSWVWEPRLTSFAFQIRLIHTAHSYDTLNDFVQETRFHGVEFSIPGITLATPKVSIVEASPF